MWHFVSSQVPATKTLNRPTNTWQPAPAEIPEEWLPPQKLGVPRVIWTLLRNLIPVAGIALFGWSPFVVGALTVLSFQMLAAREEIAGGAAPWLMTEQTVERAWLTAGWCAIYLCFGFASVVLGVIYVWLFSAGAAGDLQPLLYSAVWPSGAVLAGSLSDFMLSVRDEIAKINALGSRLQASRVREWKQRNYKSNWWVGIFILLFGFLPFFAVLGTSFLSGRFGNANAEESHVLALFGVGVLTLISIAFDLGATNRRRKQPAPARNQPSNIDGMAD